MYTDIWPLNKTQEHMLIHLSATSKWTKGKSSIILLNVSNYTINIEHRNTA